MSTPPLQLKPAALDLGRKTVRLQLALLVLAVILPAFFCLDLVFAGRARKRPANCAR